MTLPAYPERDVGGPGGLVPPAWEGDACRQGCRQGYLGQAEHQGSIVGASERGIEDWLVGGSSGRREAQAAGAK